MPLLTHTVHAWRGPDGKHFLGWEQDASGVAVDVEVLTSSETAALTWHASDAGPARVSIHGLCPETRHRFRVSDDLGNDITVAARGMGLEGARNFRDFGGYPTRSGRKVGWGHFYRSGSLSTLSSGDVKMLARLDIELVCDLRREDEQTRDPSRLPCHERPARVLSLPITPGSQASALYDDARSLDSRNAMFAFMVQINREFVHSQSEHFARMFAAILEERPRSLLVHCAAGKDRTGFAAALILAALGVPEDLILRDYLLTRHYFDPWQELPRVRANYRVDHLVDESLLPMLAVDEAYLRAAFAAIDESHGGMPYYLHKCLGIGGAERRALAALYLEE